MVKPADLRKERLSRKIAQLTAGNLVYLVAQFLVFVALTRLVTPDEVGEMSWALAIASPVFVLADMRTRQIQLSTTGLEYTYRVFWNQRIVLLIIAALGQSGAGWFLSADVGVFRILLGVVGLRVAEGLLAVPLGELIRSEKMASVALLQVFRSGMYLIPFVVVLLLTRRVDLALVAASVALVLPVVVAHRSIAGRGEGRSGWREQLQLSRQALPLGLGFFIGSLTINAPRIVLETEHGADALAAFAAVSYVIVVVNQVVDTINQGVMPRMAAHWRASESRVLLKLLRATVGAILGVGLVGTVGALLIGDWILDLVFGEFYGNSGDVMAAMLLATVIMHLAQAFRNMLIAGGLRRGVLVISIANFVITLGFVFLLVPTYAAIGVAFALAGGQAVALVIYGWLGISAVHRLVKAEGQLS